MKADGPNAEQIEYWNKQAGLKWVEQQKDLDALILPLGMEALDRARVISGECVLDVGCGTGQMSALLGERVGDAGEVLGLDISSPMLARARERCSAAGLTNADFLQADGQTHRFDNPRFDLLFSRFGVMFFAEPDAAFSNLRNALVPGGRVAFVCWQGIARNAWMREPMMAGFKHLPPPTPPKPGAPGPFAFADPDRVRSILETAGFRAIEIESVERELTVGTDLDQATDFLLNIGPLSAAMRESTPEVREAVRNEVSRALEGSARADGVHLDSAAWIVSAQTEGADS
ncbi:MAG: class I SAM-dependent methyltransferase [bacterium]|nr:class I SAM-dependent methyltransferase [bacterium]